MIITTERRERVDRFLAGISRNVLRAEAEGRFRTQVRTARALTANGWTDVSRTMITNAVDSLYRVLKTTEEP